MRGESAAQLTARPCEACRRSLRATFDESPALYDRSRASPPRELVDDLVAITQLRPGARLLEIGCGTGQATVPLAKRSFEIIAVELGEKLAALARQKLRGFPAVKIITSSLEDWDPGGERFDAVVAFNSFHWIDPALRFAKAAELLHERGYLAVVGTRFVTDEHADPVWIEIQRDHDAIRCSREPWVHVNKIRDRSTEFTASGYFSVIAVRHYLYDTTYTADDFIAFLKTSTWHRTLPTNVSQALVKRVRNRIENQSSGVLVAPTAAVLYVARRQKAHEPLRAGS